jgi:hypothetical protein
VRRGNHIDCSRGVAFARWWWLGIFSLASLTPGSASPTVQPKKLTVWPDVSTQFITEAHTLRKFHEVQGKIKEKAGKAYQ